MDRDKDTIFALASARGSAGISVIRISGDQALSSAQTLCSPTRLCVGRVRLVHLRSPQSQQVLDQVIALYFAKPNSFTGEEVVELQCHGSPAVLDAIFAELLEMGLRPADPGEFTRRAFTNGQIDLVQAEGLADLIDARTEGQRQQAIQQMGGNLSQLIEGWRLKLLKMLALTEAEIDFSEEEDVSGGLSAQVLPNLLEFEAELNNHLELAGRGKKVRDGFLIALVGPVNSGKSTLLNALAGEDRAIVSEEPGTTRDVIEIQTQIAGFLVTIADTAGLREATEKIEQEGIRRTHITANTADLRLFLSDKGSVSSDKLVKSPRPGDLFLQTKSDLMPEQKVGKNWLLISAKTGHGMNELYQRLEVEIEKRLSATDLPKLTRERHVRCIKSALVFAGLAKAELSRGSACRPELIAEDLHQCAACLGGLLGEIDTEQVLDEIFSGFCIGK